MHVASLELCKELYELSGWTGTNYKYGYKQYGDDPREFTRTEIGLFPTLEMTDARFTVLVECQAYDLGYLLRKLPQTIGTIDDGDEESLVLGAFSFDGSWYAEYGSEYSTKAGTPEDALCLLAVELKKQGILT